MLRCHWRNVGSAEITILGNLDLGLEDWRSLSQVGKRKKCFPGRSNNLYKGIKDGKIMAFLGKREKWISIYSKHRMPEFGLGNYKKYGWKYRIEPQSEEISSQVQFFNLIIKRISYVFKQNMMYSKTVLCNKSDSIRRKGCSAGGYLQRELL